VFAKRGHRPAPTWCRDVSLLAFWGAVHSELHSSVVPTDLLWERLQKWLRNKVSPYFVSIHNGSTSVVVSNIRSGVNVMPLACANLNIVPVVCANLSILSVVCADVSIVPVAFADLSIVPVVCDYLSTVPVACAVFST
jgi:hypothetical protein